MVVNPFAGAFKLLYDNCEGFRNFINNFVNTIKNFFVNMGNKIKEVVIGIRNKFSSIIGDMANIGGNLVRGLWNGISNVKNWILNKIKGFGNSILKSIKKIFGIHSPSTEFAYVGKMNVLGLEEGMESMQGDLQSTFDGMFNLSPNLYGRTSTNLSPQVNVTVNNNMETDPLGQVVNNIKTFAGGSKNDYNYGQGV